MSSTALAIPTRNVLTTGIVLEGFRATPPGGDVFKYLLGTSSADGWHAPAPLQVLRLSIAMFVITIGSASGAFNLRLHKDTLASGDRILSVDIPFIDTPGTNVWYANSDETVNNAGKEILDTGDALILEARSHPGTTNTVVTKVSAWVDYEYI